MFGYFELGTRILFSLFVCYGLQMLCDFIALVFISWRFLFSVSTAWLSMIAN